MNPTTELPVVDESTCTGCGDCVSVCPTRCLELSRRLAWLPRPADCVSCAACVWVCPVNAITMEEMMRDERPRPPQPS